MSVPAVTKKAGVAPAKELELNKGTSSAAVHCGIAFKPTVILRERSDRRISGHLGKILRFAQGTRGYS